MLGANLQISRKTRKTIWLTIFWKLFKMSTCWYNPRMHSKSTKRLDVHSISLIIAGYLGKADLAANTIGYYTGGLSYMVSISMKHIHSQKCFSSFETRIQLILFDLHELLLKSITTSRAFLADSENTPNVFTLPDVRIWYKMESPPIKIHVSIG